jgi:tRNA (Thr-GGU) A37 N-methylase
VIHLQPIGYVRSARTDLRDDGWGRVPARIELTADFGPEALDGLEELSHAGVVFHFDRVAESAVERGARHPRGNPAWPRVGILAQRAKGRPNRLGVTVVQIQGKAGPLTVVGSAPALEAPPRSEPDHG